MNATDPAPKKQPGARSTRVAFSILLLAQLVVCTGIAAPQTPPQTTPPEKTSPSAGGNAGNGTNSGGGGANSGASAQNISWSIGRPPERWRFPDNSEISFTVTAGEKELNDVRLADSTLQDATSFLRLDANEFELCADKQCNSQIDVPAQTTRRLTLKIRKEFESPGAFTGDITLRTTGKADPQSFKLTVYSRQSAAMVWGAFLIAVGLGFYFAINVFLRRRITLDEALLPAYQLRDSIETLKQSVEEVQRLTQISLPALVGALKELDEQLTPKAFSAKAPPVIVLPWSSGTAWQDNLKTFLAPITDRLASLIVLVNSGVRFAELYWDTHPDPVKAVLSKIDALVPSVSNAATAQSQLAPILKDFQAAVNPPQAAALAPILDAAPSKVAARFFTLPPDSHTLQLRLLRNTLWVWWLVALVALLGGYYAVVLLNLGFGSCTDYIKCFFWGLGFSVAGTQLDQLTQTAVSGNFGITIPKA